MALYQYRCAEHGVFEVRRPIGEATARCRCPRCADDSARVFSPPFLGRTPASVVGAIERAEKSRSEPEVVAGPPPRTATRVPNRLTNPALRGLPRP